MDERPVRLWILPKRWIAKRAAAMLPPPADLVIQELLTFFDLHQGIGCSACSILMDDERSQAVL
jgi:hypothetical protein